jgi:hypothetical protein
VVTSDGPPTPEYDVTVDPFRLALLVEYEQREARLRAGCPRCRELELELLAARGRITELETRRAFADVGAA